jgi:hypothetical protein
MAVTNFQGLTVLTLESRPGQEMIRLMETYGRRPLHPQAMREVQLSSNPQALNFATALLSETRFGGLSDRSWSACAFASAGERASQGEVFRGIEKSFCYRARAETRSCPARMESADRTSCA